MASQLFDLLTGIPFLLPGEGATDEAPSRGTDQVDDPQLANEWGIFKGGVLVLQPDSMVEIEYRREWRLADYQMEKGAFETYDKVAVPFDIHLRLAKGGSQSDRTAFLKALEDVAAPLDLYDVVTPERTYASVNIAQLGYRRTSNIGMGLLTIDIGLREVRVTAQTQFVNTKAPQAAAAVSTGTVQTTPAPAAQQAQVASDVQAASPAESIDQAALAAAPPMTTIPLAAVASQVLNVTLDGVACRLAPRLLATGLVIDAYVNDVLVAGSAAVRTGVPILRDSYLGFPGDLAFVDTQGNDDPTFDGLGDRFQLLHIPAAAAVALGLK